MGVKVTVPNNSSDSVTFGSANTPTAAEVKGYDDGSSNGHLEFYTTASGTSAEKMRISSSGNVGIGTNSPKSNSGYTTLTLNNASNGGVLEFTNNGTTINQIYNDASGAYIATASGKYLQLNAAGSTYISASTNGSERMRIDSSGNLLVGGTTQYNSSRLTVVGSISTSSQVFSGGNGSSFWKAGAETNTGTPAYIIYNTPNTGVFLTWNATSWSANSDERLKTTLTPFENAAAKVATLRAGTGRYLTDDEGVSRSFLIAQDVQAVLPEAVDVQSDEQGTLGLRYQDLIPLLTAAIQEQQAIISTQADTIASMEARLTALENK